MYFIGWNPSTTVHTRNAIGLAISDDNGQTFTRAYEGAVPTGTTWGCAVRITSAMRATSSSLRSG